MNHTTPERGRLSAPAELAIAPSSSCTRPSVRWVACACERVARTLSSRRADAATRLIGAQGEGRVGGKREGNLLPKTSARPRKSPSVESSVSAKIFPTTSENRSDIIHEATRPWESQYPSFSQQPWPLPTSKKLPRLQPNSSQVRLWLRAGSSQAD